MAPSSLVVCFFFYVATLHLRFSIVPPHVCVRLLFRSCPWVSLVVGVFYPLPFALPASVLWSSLTSPPYDRIFSTQHFLKTVSFVVIPPGVPFHLLASSSATSLSLCSRLFLLTICHLLQPLISQLSHSHYPAGLLDFPLSMHSCHWEYSLWQTSVHPCFYLISLSIMIIS